MVKEELQDWKDVVPSMMSEEESTGDGFVWHRQSW